MELPLPRPAAFEFFADVFNLERITPPDVRFRILTPPPIPLHQGTRIDYTLTVFGLPFRWRTAFTVWDPPARFVDQQERGPYRRWVHAHDFEQRGDRTLIRDRVEYELPLPPLGELAHPIVRRKLERIFDFRREEILRIFAGAS
jgi:ligand-binding SRPBCC domain-containing protein